MGELKTPDDLRRVIADPAEDAVDKRKRELREAHEAEERTQRALEIQRAEQQQTAQQAAANNWAAQEAWVARRIDDRIEHENEIWRDAIGQVISEERGRRDRKIKEAIEEAKRWVEGKFEARLTALEQRVDTLREALGKESIDRAKEVNAAVDEAKRAVEARLEARLDTKLTTLEERLKTVAGKLPVAKTWSEATVTYQGEFVCYKGSTFQARRDTAQPPGGDDWVPVARAGRDGRDAITPNICGTFDAYGKYKRLDVVVMDGAAFIAKRDNPGICPGAGWQMLARQGKPGRKGETGERGPRGEKGEKGDPVMPKLVHSKIDENYNLIILRADESLEIIPLRQAFERFYSEVSE